jgi:trigger factor
MEIAKEQLGSAEYRLKIKLAPNEWEGYVNQAATRLSSEMKIKGFRPGQAPLPMVRSMMGDTKVAAAASEIALPEIFMQAVNQENLTPIAQPKVILDKLNLDEPLELTLEVVVLPEVKLGDYKSLRLTKLEAPEVSPEQLETVLNNFQRREAKFVDVSRVVENGDWVEIDFDGTLNGEPFEGGQSKNHPLIVGDKVFVPDFEAGLLGMKEGEEKTFDVTFSGDFHKDTLRGKTVQFKVKILSHKGIEMPELNDEFAKKHSQFETLADFKEDIKKHLAAEILQRKRHEQEDEAITKLIGITDAALPDALIDQEAEALLHDQKHQVSHDPAMNWDEYLARLGKSEAEVLVDLKIEAKRRLLASLALAEVRKAEGIEVADGEVEAEIARMKLTNPEANDQIEAQFKNPQEVSRLKSAMAGKKTIDKLMEIVTQ